MGTGKIAVVLLAAACGLAAEVEQKETIQKSFAGARSVDVDAIVGGIAVSGYDGSEVQVTAQKVLRADTPEKAEEARRDVKLEFEQKGDTLRIFVDSPERCKCSDGSLSYNGRRGRGYKVSYDFGLRVPRATGLRLKTIVGKVRVENTTGDFDVDSINGSVKLDEVSGSGRAHSLNGGVEARFVHNPARPSSFESLNGKVEVTFQPDLSADLRFKTFNGGVYTDFDVTSLPEVTPAAERKNGKFVYRRDRWFGARAGKGGPEYKFDAFNGDIRILKRGQ